MGLIVTLILAVIGIVLLFGNSNYYLPRKPLLPVVGFVLVLVASYCLGSVFILKDAIKEREQVITSKETLAYQLVPFDFALSEYEMEDSNQITRYYVRFFDENKFHFYYKTNQDGIDGFAPETIHSYNIFITENYEGSPMITKTTTVYELPVTKLEELWLSSDAVKNFGRKTITTYEIYVPQGSIIETANSKK